MPDVPDTGSAGEAAPRLDGDGWVRCEAGHKHWGRYGAAGLLLRAPAGDEPEPSVLLQRRAWWTHHGDTWGVPGGARASHESPEQAAMRETGEEVDVDLAGVTIDRVHVDDHGGWSYWTVLATVPDVVPVSARSRETAAVRWVPTDDVDGLSLHPGFAAAWPQLRGA